MSLVKCPECGLENIQSNLQACPNCGFPIRDYFSNESSGETNLYNSHSSYSTPVVSSAIIVEPEKENTETKPKTNPSPQRQTSSNLGIFVFAVVLYILSAVMLYKGYDKMTNYRNSDTYYSINQNAYVGGDAYNYIINGTYATGFFVLSMGFFISGTCSVLGGIIINKMN